MKGQLYTGLPRVALPVSARWVTVDEVARADSDFARHRTVRADVAAIGLYVLAAVFVTYPLWAAPGLRVAATIQQDPALFQWFFAHAARVVTHAENPLFTSLMNAPDGVNVMANTSVMGLGIPLAPVTLLFGPHVSLLAVTTIGLAGTAAGWYLLLSRRVVSSTLAAAIGGWLCGFAPPLISHANWHPNLTFQVLVPFIVWQVLKLREPGRKWRNGFVLALLVVWQAFISEEVLFLTALGCGVFLMAVAVIRPNVAARSWRPMLGSLAVTTAVAGILLAYPIWMQFFGPGHYRGLAFAPGRPADLASFHVFASESLGGEGTYPGHPSLASNPGEENVFFGWPLLLLVGLSLLILSRHSVARALKFTAIVFAVLALGSEVTFRGKNTGIPGPWSLLDKLPLFDSLLPTRLGLVVTPLLAALVALATHRVWDWTAHRAHPTWMRFLWVLAVAAALVPSAPTPLNTAEQSPVPSFFTDGSWRNYVARGDAVVPVPIPNPATTDGMRWSAAADLGFAIPGGYFIHPRGGIDGEIGAHGAPLAPTAVLLNTVASTGVRPPISDAARLIARADIRDWQAAIFVLSAAEVNADALRATLDDLLGPGERRYDVWVWDVRSPGTSGTGGRVG
ncbi:MAG: hypothetical protein WD646_11595 [Actinomycetota bacterium]